MSGDSSESGPKVNRLTETATSVPTAGAQRAELPPPAIPDHEVLRLIGRGSYGEVWLARTALGEYRAVKIVYRKTFDQDKPYEREFNGLKKFEPISHARESQVDIYHVGRNDAAGFFYYIMELADDATSERSNGVMESGSDGGKPETQHSNTPPLQHPSSYSPHTLKHDLRTRGALPVAECVQIALPLTRALEHLHAHGLVHRDIKPSNIIFVNGVPKLADIGLVTSVDATRSFVGTDGYIPPEGPGTPPADLYSLGKVLYEMITGKDRLDFPELPADWRTRPDFDQLLEFNEILTKACDNYPRQRYRSAEEIHADLALLQCGKSVKRKRVLHHWLSVGKKTGLVVSLLAVVVAAVVLRQHPSDPFLHSAIPGVDKLVEQGNSVVQDRSPERIRTALGYYNEAIQLDPNFVPAQFGVLMTLVYRGCNRWNAPDEVRRELRAVAKKLMDLDSHLAEPHIASSMIKWGDWQFPEALEEALLATQKQAASKEGEAVAHGYYGYLLLQTGKPDEALEQYRLAEEKAPSGAMIQHHLGHPYFVKKDFKQAQEHYQESLRFAPGQETAHYFSGRVYEEQTNFMPAIQKFEEWERMDGRYNAERKAFYDELREAVKLRGPEGYWRKRLDLALGKSQPDLYYIATLYARLGEKDKAYAYLKKACEKRAFDQGLMFDLCWDHDDPEFRAIARGIRLLE